MANLFQEIPIDQLCVKVTSGSTPLRSRSNYFRGGKIDWYKTGELNDWYLPQAEEKITEKALRETSVKIFPKNTVLIAMYGDGKTITSMGLLREPAATNQACCAMLVDESKCDTRYFFYALKARRHILLKLAYGGAQRNLAASLIKQFRLPVPDIPIQLRIAATLSAYDDLIENNLRRIKILEEMASIIYRDWFPSRTNTKRSEGCFGDLITIGRDGINPFEFPGEEFEHFSIPAFDDGCIPAIEVGESILSGKYCVDASCVLLSKLNPRIARSWLPVPSGQRRAITSTEFLVLKPAPGVTREFVYAKCCSDDFARSFASLAIGTSTSHQRVKPDNLLALPCTIPERSAISSFSAIVSPIFNLVHQLRAQKQILGRTRDLLLPRLLSGQRRSS